MGRPKALVELDGEPLVARALRALGDAGLARRIVVLGERAGEAAAHVPGGVEVVVADGWAEGMGASLRAGLAAAAREPGTDAVLVLLVDTPGIGAAALARVAAAASGPDALARGAVDGRAGHPVLLGRAHWDAVVGSARGDVGARAYLAGRPGTTLVEVGDVADAVDLDTPEDLAARRAAGQARRKG